MKAAQMRTAGGYLFRAHSTKGVRYHHLLLAWWKIGRVGSGKALQWYVLIRNCWCGKVGGGLTRSRTSYKIGLERIFGLSLVGPEFEAKKIGKLSVMDQVLTILGRLL